MTEYNVNPAEPLTIQFAPLNVVMAAHYVHLDDEHEGSVRVEMKPVLGVLVQHEFNKHGEIEGSIEEMAVQYDDTGEICTVSAYARACGLGSALIGVYPYKIKPEPTQEDVEATVHAERWLMARRKAEAEKKAAA